MINIEKDTPIEYSKQSRDYQVFSFLFTLLFNQPKMFVDLIKNIWTDNIDSKLLDLRSYTLNFIPKYEWENKNLLGVTNNFRHLLRTKGTYGAIKEALQILSRIKGISADNIDVEPGDTPGTVRLIMSEEIANASNIEDLFRYILPAGCLYEIIKFSRYDSNARSDIVVEDYATSEGYYLSTDLGLPDGGENKEIGSQSYGINLHTIDYSTGMLITGDSEGGKVKPLRP